MKSSLLKSAIISAVLALGIGTNAFALPITGNIDLSGGAVLNNANLALATQVTSWGGVTVSTPQGVTVGSVLDTFINPGDAVTMTGPWVFSAGKSALWSVGGFTFDLLTSSVVLQNNTFLNVQGFGTISGNGYSNTAASWVFTTQGTAANGTTFSFSATSSPVPDGGTTALLLGFGLTGLALLSRGYRKLV